MRLIDADAMRAEWLEDGENEYVYDTNCMLDSIDKQPTIEAESVRHGKWCIHKVDAHVSTFYCSECDRTVQCGNDDFMKPTKLVSKIYPYCHCGAKMDLEGDDNA